MPRDKKCPSVACRGSTWVCELWWPSLTLMATYRMLCVLSYKTNIKITIVSQARAQGKGEYRVFCSTCNLIYDTDFVQQTLRFSIQQTRGILQFVSPAQKSCTCNHVSGKRPDPMPQATPRSHCYNFILVIFCLFVCISISLTCFVTQWNSDVISEVL